MASLVTARLVSTPFVYPDGQVDVRDEVIRSPESVELDGSWVHIVTHDGLGNRTLLRSYLASEIQRIEWVKKTDA